MVNFSFSLSPFFSFPFSAFFYPVGLVVGEGQPGGGARANESFASMLVSIFSLPPTRYCRLM